MIIESVVCVDHLTTASDQHAWHSVQAPSGLRQGLQWLSIIPLMLVAVLVWLSRDVLESKTPLRHLMTIEAPLTRRRPRSGCRHATSLSYDCNTVCMACCAK